MAFDREGAATAVAPGVRPGAPAGEPAISVAGLVKSFGAVRALDRVDLYVAPGTMLGLLGPNGAGKTTCVRVWPPSCCRTPAPRGWPASTPSATPRRCASGSAWPG